MPVIFILSAILLFSGTAIAQKTPACERMKEYRRIGRLNYFSLNTQKGGCIVSVSYTYDDGVTRYWVFDEQGKMAVSVDTQDRKGASILLSQNFVFPGNKNPQIKNLKTEPPTLKIIAANGSELFFDINSGKFLPTSVPNLKYLSNFEIREDITQMVGDLKNKPNAEKKKYLKNTVNRDLATVEIFSGEYLKYKAKFGESSDSTYDVALEIIQKVQGKGEKRCELISNDFMANLGNGKVDQFSQVYSEARLKNVKASKCAKQPSWLNVVYPQASESNSFNAQ